MSYIVYTSSGTILTTVPTGKVNTGSTSLTLIGRDVTNYGRSYNQNLVHLLGNFASQTSPNNPLLGQLWYDLNFNKMKLYTGSEFRPLYSMPYGDLDTEANGGEIGEFYFDTKNHELNFFDADAPGQWQTVTSYPRTQISGWKHPQSPVKNDGTGTSAIVENVTLLQHYGYTIGALSLTAFTASEKDSTSTFSLAGTSSFRVAAGLTIIGELQSTTGTFQRLNVTGVDEAISTTTGALTVAGGVGIRGNLHVGGEIVANKLTVELTTVTTTLVVTDDVIETENTTQSESTTTGALIVAGGAGIGKNLNVGGYGHFTGTFDETTTTVGVYVGVAGSPPESPRIMFAASTGTNWEIDNYGGTLRVYQPTGVALSFNDTTHEATFTSTATFTDVNVTGNLLVSSLAFNYRNVTGDFVGTTETIIGVNSVSTCTITLPVAQSGRFIIIKDESGAADINNMTIVPQSGTIDGDPSVLIDLGYSAYNFYSNGTDWFIV